MNSLESTPSHIEVIRLIGAGGMGMVYEARDTRLQRRIALKELHPHLTVRDDMRGRLLREAQLAARVEHENVVRIYNIHEIRNVLFLEMEFVDGVPLSQLISNRTISPGHAVDLLAQVLRALIACHAQKLVHGDLKPSNLLVTPEGKILLTDFGISQATRGGENGQDASASWSQSLWGTPAYCPPQAWDGEFPSQNWDLYALGILTFEALTGRLPYSAETPAVLMREKLSGNRLRIDLLRYDLSPELSELIDNLSADDAEYRPTSAQVALDQLMATPEMRKGSADTTSLAHAKSTIDLIPSALPKVFKNRNGGAPTKTVHQRTWFFTLVALFAASSALGLAIRGLNYTSGPSDTSAFPFIEAEGKVGEISDLYFTGEYVIYSYDDGIHGRELWVTEANGRTRLVADISPGKSSSNPTQFLKRSNGGFIFSATTSQLGEEPWFCEPKPPSPRLLKDVAPGPNHSTPRPVAAWDHLFLFYATNLNSQQGLWITDSATDRTGLLRHSAPNAESVNSINTRTFVHDSEVYFITPEVTDNELIKYDFRSGAFQNIGAINPSVRDLAVFGDTVVFGMADPDHGYELWMIDINDNETRLMCDIWPGVESGNPEDFYEWDGEVYFRASTPANGAEIWKTDGTPRGTVQVADVQPGPSGSGPSTFVGTKERLFFRANSAKSGTELWSTSGVANSEIVLHDVWPGTGSSHPYNFAVLGDYIFFSADHEAYGEELWALDLKKTRLTPTLVRDIRPGTKSAEPNSLTPTSTNSGVFIYKSEVGDQLMMLGTVEGEIVLKACEALPLAIGADK